MAKKVVRKSASKEPRPEKSLSGKRRHPDALENPEANDAAITAKSTKQNPQAQRVAKVVHLIISVGDDDRERDFDAFVDDIKKKLGAPAKVVDSKGNRSKGPHVSTTGGYYILDGKVCLPEDYDAKRQAFKKGAVPPSWAGGPKTNSMTGASTQKQLDWDLENLSEDEYDKKYGLGKYKPKPKSYETSAEHDARMRRERAAAKAAEDDELEEFDWDEDDALDDEKMGKVADASASAAVKKMKSKKVVKKPAPKKRAVRRVKK